MTEAMSAGRRADTSGAAITALVFGVLTWLVLPVVGAVIALFYVRRARHELADDPALGGVGYLTAAKSLAVVQLVAVLLAGVAVFAVALAVGSHHTSRAATPAPPVDRTAASQQPSTAATTPPPVEGRQGVLVSAPRLVTLLRAAPVPATRLGGVFAVRSIGFYAWADGGPPAAAGALRFNLAPRPPTDATLVRLIVYRHARQALNDLSTTAGNFGADDLGRDPSIGRPAACWTNDGYDVCDMQVGRVVVDVTSPTNSYGSLKMARQTVAWLLARIPAEDRLTPAVG